MIFVLTIFLGLIASTGFSFSTDPDNNRNTQQMIEARGYPCLNYTIETNDHYLLTIFRIPGPKDTKLSDAMFSVGPPIVL